MFAGEDIKIVVKPKGQSLSRKRVVVVRSKKILVASRRGGLKSRFR